MRRMIIAVCLVGCSASHGLRDEVQAWADALDRAACEREMRCESQTVARLRVHCHPGVGTIFSNGAPALAAEGALAFDAAAAAACVAELEVLPCHVVTPGREETPSCWNALTPTRALGESCSPTPGRWSGCAGTYCASTDGCHGTCVAGGDAGDSCEVRGCTASSCSLWGSPPRAMCVAPGGDRCEDTCPSRVCRDGVCVAVPVVGVGEACGPEVATCADGSECIDATCRPHRTGGVDDPCIGAASCMEGLWCDEGRCAPLLPPGAACDSGRACGPEARHCTRGICSTDAPPEWTQCYGNHSGLWPPTRACPSGFSCDAEEQECRPTAALGEACDRWTNVCTEGARCVEGRCRTIVGDAEDCDADHVCASTLECLDGRCGPLPELGEPCRDACFGAECVAGTCTVRAPGAACDDGVQCDSGLCRDGACTPVGGEGAPCGASRGRCARGLACFGDADDVGRCLPLGRCG